MQVKKMIFYFKNNQNQTLFWCSQCSDRTVRRLLNKYGFCYRQATSKGLLIENDLKVRMKFAKDIKKYYDDGL